MITKSFELKVRKLIVGNGQIIENANVGLKDGKIREVSVENLKQDYDEIIDFSNKYVIPGLIDAHVHIRYSPLETMEESRKRSDEYQAIVGLKNAQKALFAGVTAMADAGATRNITFSVRNAINNGITFGPRLFVSGEIIRMTGASEKPESKYELTGADPIRKASRELLMYYGADFLKLSASGAISRPHTNPRHPKLNVDEMKAAVDEAHKCEKKVHVHCYGEKAIENTIKAGADCIVHGQSLTDQHIKIMKERGMILLPTLKTYCDQIEKKSESYQSDILISSGIWDETEPNFRNAHENGITIAMGTDAGMTDNFFGDNPLDLKYMVDWGMTPHQAIIAGTLNAARSIGVDKSIGTIEPNKYGDLLILKKDPLKDIHNLWGSLDKIMLSCSFLSSAL
jgi:imidazolonepropionase-like amidohydrolase